jgi:hypothetical protein
VTGLAVDETGGRLFAVTDQGGVSRIDLHSGSITELIPNDGLKHFFSGPVGKDAFGSALCMTRALVL